jgi:O-antigen ligase
MAAAALLAVALRAHQLAKRVAGIPMGVAAAVLAATTVLCQSVGSILLLFLLLPLTLSTRRSTLRLYAALAILGIVGFTLLLVATHGSLRAASQHNSILQTLAAILAKSGRGSLSWRLARDTNHIGLALHRPLLGYGSWAWWQNGDVRPWSLWLLLFGMYGAVGLLAFAAILFLPILAAVASLKAERNAARRQLAMAIVAVTLMIAADDLLNSAMILPYLLLFAGLASISIPPPSTLPRPPAAKAPRVVRPVSRVTSFSATPSAATSAPRPRA